MQGPQLPLPGHAFQLNQAEKEVPQELYQTDRMVESQIDQRIRSLAGPGTRAN